MCECVRVAFLVEQRPGVVVFFRLNFMESAFIEVAVNQFVVEKVFGFSLYLSLLSEHIYNMRAARCHNRKHFEPHHPHIVDQKTTLCFACEKTSFLSVIAISFVQHRQHRLLKCCGFPKISFVHTHALKLKGKKSGAAAKNSLEYFFDI